MVVRSWAPKAIGEHGDIPHVLFVKHSPAGRVPRATSTLNLIGSKCAVTIRVYSVGVWLNFSGMAVVIEAKELAIPNGGRDIHIDT